jgi:Ser/Thr protein kinase RdoA (MazF antagonist)
MNHTDIIYAFGFQIDPPGTLESIYPYAPVYRVQNTHGEWIVKRTQAPLARAHAIAKWTRSLAAQGVGIVKPASGVGDNPRYFGDANDQEMWIVYPFVHGTAYVGAIAEIRSAGDLLGRIHAAGMNEAFGLKVSETVVPIAADELTRDTNIIVRLVTQAFPERAAAARELLEERTHHYLRSALPRLLSMRLPLTNASWDYKAINLVYRPDGEPVLVDPDNGGRIPRVYDLAIAALLFHNDVKWPGRVFSAREWHAFLEGYGQHIRLSDEEMSVWDDLLLCAWIDEALWLLSEDEAGWKDDRQSGLLMSLLSTPLSSFAVARKYEAE